MDTDRHDGYVNWLRRNVRPGSPFVVPAKQGNGSSRLVTAVPVVLLVEGRPTGTPSTFSCSFVAEIHESVL
jgi:hypothetical protein